MYCSEWRALKSGAVLGWLVGGGCAICVCVRWSVSVFVVVLVVVVVDRFRLLNRRNGFNFVFDFIVPESRISD